MRKKLFSVMILMSVLLSMFSVNIASANDQKNLKKLSNSTVSARESKLHDHIQGEIIVKYKFGTHDKKKAELEKKVSADTIKSGRDNVKLLKVKENDLINTMEMLEANPEVEYAVPNYIRKAMSFPSDPPNDPRYTNQKGLQTVKAPEAWAKMGDAAGMSEIIVAVVDTGIDINHEDLKDKISPDGYDFCDLDNDPSPGPFNMN